MRDAAYEHHDDPADGSKGSKRTLSSTLRELAATVPGFDTAAFWSELANLVAKACVALQVWSRPSSACGALRWLALTLP